MKVKNRWSLSDKLRKFTWFKNWRILTLNKPVEFKYWNGFQFGLST
jgi:hypothetical protein